MPRESARHRLSLFSFPKKIISRGGAFRKAKYEIRRRKSEDGQKFLPPNPLPFCPPERSVWRAKRAINSVQKRVRISSNKRTMKNTLYL